MQTDVNDLRLCLLGKEMRKENTKGMKRERKGKKKISSSMCFWMYEKKEGNNFFPFFGFQREWKEK